MASRDGGRTWTELIAVSGNWQKDSQSVGFLDFSLGFTIVGGGSHNQTGSTARTGRLNRSIWSGKRTEKERERE